MRVDYVLNMLRAIVVILAAISLIIITMDRYNFAKLKINHTLKIIIYLIFIVCSLFFSVDGFLIWYQSR